MPLATFLVCGGLAAAVNWLARIGFSRWLGFELAVIAAYLLGMGVGFALYRCFVWPGAGGGLARQIMGFICVNALSAVLVLTTAVGLAEFAGLLSQRSPLAEALAHGAAIAVGAVANCLGHAVFTFAGPRPVTRPASAPAPPPPPH